MATELPPELEKIRDEYDAKMAKLEAQNEKLIEALEFYADKSNFTCVDEGRNFMAHYVVYEINPETCGDDAPGTFARQALREVRGEE